MCISLVHVEQNLNICPIKIAADPEWCFEIPLKEFLYVDGDYLSIVLRKRSLILLWRCQIYFGGIMTEERRKPRQTIDEFWYS